MSRIGKQPVAVPAGVEFKLEGGTATLKGPKGQLSVPVPAGIPVHLADGPQGNSVSKATLLLAAEGLCRRFPDRVCYFPSFEILLDELRDYRFYAEDLVHPSAQAASYIADRFIAAAVPEEENLRLAEARKTALRAAHRDLR